MTDPITKEARTGGTDGSGARMNLSLRQLRAFVAIARLQSFTRAAETMHISQAGLSSMLRDVETQLGCRLFDRTTRHVAPTDQGRALLPVATRVLIELDGAQASIGRMSDTARRTLVVGATPLVASCVMPEVCGSFARQRPDVTVTVSDLGRGAIVDGVRAGDLDAGFGVFLDVACGVRRVRLLETPLLLVMADASTGEPPPKALKWADLRTLPLLGLPLQNPIQQCVDAQLATIGRANEVRLTFNYLHTVLSMVEAGIGSAILPSFVSAATKRYRVRLVPLARPRVDVEFFEITRTGRPRSPVVAAFSACLMQALAGSRAGRA